MASQVFSRDLSGVNILREVPVVPVTDSFSSAQRYWMFRYRPAICSASREDPLRRRTARVFFSDSLSTSLICCGFLVPFRISVISGRSCFQSGGDGVLSSSSRGVGSIEKTA